MREAFLKALKENEDDIDTRMVYADWLEDNCEFEEAERQRKWPAAKAWLMVFCESNNGSSYEMEISYQDLMHSANVAAEDDDWSIGCGDNMTICDELRMNYREFWENWSIVSGIPLPDDLDHRTGFSCAC